MGSAMNRARARRWITLLTIYLLRCVVGILIALWRDQQGATAFRNKVLNWLQDHSAVKTSVASSRL
jgi:hypothetical protein